MTLRTNYRLIRRLSFLHYYVLNHAWRRGRSFVVTIAGPILSQGEPPSHSKLLDSGVLSRRKEECWQLITLIYRIGKSERKVTKMRSSSLKRHLMNRIQYSLRLYKIPVFGKAPSQIPTSPLNKKVLGHIVRFWNSGVFKLAQGAPWSFLSSEGFRGNTKWRGLYSWHVIL